MLGVRHLVVWSEGEEEPVGVDLVESGRSLLRLLLNVTENNIRTEMWSAESAKPFCKNLRKYVWPEIREMDFRGFCAQSS